MDGLPRRRVARRKGLFPRLVDLVFRAFRVRIHMPISISHLCHPLYATQPLQTRTRATYTICCGPTGDSEVHMAPGLQDYELG